MKLMKRILIILAFCVAISILITVSPISKVFTPESPQLRAPSPQKISLQKIDNSIPVLGLGISLPKYFKNVIQFKQNGPLPKRIVIFVNITQAKRYKSFLSQELRDGSPVIFVGNASSHFSEILSSIKNNSEMFFVPKEGNGTPCWIYGIIEDPWNKVPGAPIPTSLFGAGGNVAMAKSEGILDAYNWASREINLIFPFYNCEATSWIQIGSIEEIFYFPPYGEMKVFTRYFCLSNFSQKNSTLLLIHVYHYLIPGTVLGSHIKCYREGWTVNTFFEKISSSDPRVILSDYHPTTCFDINDLSINFESLGGGGLEVTSWRFSAGPSGALVNVYDYSDYADNTAWWVWKVDRPLNKAFPLKTEPGAIMILHLKPNSHNSITWNEEYGVQFLKKVGGFGGDQESPLYSCEYSVVLSWRRSSGYLR